MVCAVASTASLTFNFPELSAFGTVALMPTSDRQSGWVGEWVGECGWVSGWMHGWVSSG